MLKSITQFSVKYPVSVSMIILATLLLGYISFDKLGIELFPDLNSPRLFIEIKAGERPPEEMEEKFVENVEALAIRQSGVVNVSSVSRVGVAQIEVEYSWDKDMDEAFLDLSKALSSFNQNNDLDELNITQHDPNADPVMLVAMRHSETNDLNELRKVAENYVRNELIRLEGIADVDIDGVEEMEVLVETNDYLLKSYGIDLASISTKIQSFNQNVSGGSIVEMGKRYVVRGLSELEQIQDLENIIVKISATDNSSPGKRVPVLLKDVAKIRLQSKDLENAVTLNGESCIGLSIYKEMRYNTVKAVDELKLALIKMEKALPGFTFTIIEDQGEFVSEAIGEVRDSALSGIILAVFVLLIFLRKIGPTAIVSAAIPISIIATFSLMYFTGLTLNIMTLGGLALGAGMLVDNSIVVLENVFRKHEAGESAKDSAINGTSEVGGAIIASTLTTIVVFIPIVYMHGAAGELFREQAFTVAFSLLCSLVVAILIIPMLYSRLYQKKSPFEGKKQESIKFNGYGRFLEKILNYKAWILITTLVLIGSGWLMLQDMGSEFMPKSETREFYIDLKMSEGTRLERTAGAVKSIEELLRELAPGEIELIYSEIGPTSGLSTAGGNVFDDQNMSTIKVKLIPDGLISTSFVIASLNDMFSESQNIELVCRQEETALQSILGTDEAPLVIEISGDEMSVLEDLSLQVIKELENIDGLQNIISSVEGGAPEVDIKIDRYRAGLMNIDISTLINRVSEKLQGSSAGQMTVKGDLTDISVKLKDISLKELETLSIEVNNSEVLLKEIAEISIGNSPKEILHNNQNRIIKITADLNKDIALDKMAESIDLNLARIEFQPDYKYLISGEEALRRESMSSLSFALLLSLILVYMVLASQFESLVHPFTILLTVPLSVVGALAIFYFQGKSLNIMAVIGIIMLVGIAVNNSIILVDAINRFRQSGMKLKEAIVMAGQRRIRPIIMTSLTTILALLPLTFGFGESASLRSPMAWAVIGGLITSTLLTLVVIPCVYLFFGQLELRWSKSKNPEIEA
ncbi:MAG: efflux RND transporter permease subunit [Bacteroidales bacterium]|nr:efflux RND transporter permease subunit [Bacteroidales bacterium]MCF8391935.1 efflux RND transporter permease subunit [Bacteroidales bacterium]